MKLAIVHDFLLGYGGAERVLEHVHELFPDAPVYTLRYNTERMHHRMDGWDIRTSFIEKMPILSKRGHTLAMPLYPLGMEQFDFSEYDVVLSLSSAFAHGVLTQPSTTHICYYHTPTRFLWDYHYQYLKERGWDKGIKGNVVKRFFHKLRIWDYVAAQRPDICLSNSQTVADRLTKFYQRDSEVVYPGLELDKHSVSSEAPQDYYLTVSRLTPPKRLELAVEACTALKRPLHVVGTGEDLERLRSLAGPTVSFLGFLSDEQVEKEMQHCRALLWPGIDDFGLVPVEAMACGRPVVAYNLGGATETVVHGKTGVLFNDHSKEGMIAGIEAFEEIEKNLKSDDIAKHAQKFSKESFQKNIKAIIEKAAQ